MVWNSKYYGTRFHRRSQNFGFHMIARPQLMIDHPNRRGFYLLRSWSQTIAEVCFNMIADDRRTFCDQRSVIAWYKFFRLLFLQHQVFFFWQQLFFNLHHLISIAASFICILKKLFKVTATLKFAAEIINHFHQLLKLPHVHCAVGRRSSAILLPI